MSSITVTLRATADAMKQRFALACSSATARHDERRRKLGELARYAVGRMTKPVRNLGVKNVDFGGISRPSRAVR